VAVALNLREPEVTQLYKECWNLRQLYDLNQIYLETNGYLAPLVRLYRLCKTAGMDSERVVRLLAIANNDLPSLENRYNNLKEEVNSLEEQKRNSDRKLLELKNQITESSNYVENYKPICRQEETKLEGLQQKRMKDEALVRNFENNNPEYFKIRKTVEERVHSALSDRKRILKLALLSLTESIKKDPEKYISLICHDTLITDYSGKYHTWHAHGFYTYGQKRCSSEIHDRGDYISMLVEEADKQYEKLAKDLVDEIISEYTFNTSSPSLSSLSSLSPSEQEYFQSRAKK
jgi:hypothetical protein